MPISWNEFFSKILKKPFIVQKKMILHMNRLLVFFEMKHFFFYEMQRALVWLNLYGREAVRHKLKKGGRHLVDIIGDFSWTKGVTSRGHFLGEFSWTFFG